MKSVVTRKDKENMIIAKLRINFHLLIVNISMNKKEMIIWVVNISCLINISARNWAIFNKQYANIVRISVKQAD